MRGDYLRCYCSLTTGGAGHLESSLNESRGVKRSYEVIYYEFQVNSKNDEGTHSTDGVRCCKAFGDKRFGGFVDEDQAAYFNGSTEHAYLSGGITPITSSNATDFSFEFRTDSSTGVLWWQSGWSGSSESDLLIIHLRKGRVNVAVNLGKDQLKSVSTNAFVADGKWHRIAVHRRMQRTTVSIDGKKTTIVSSPGAVLLNTNGLVYIGGRTGHAVQSRFRGNFVGCVRRLIILETAIDLFKDTVSLLSPSSCPSTRF
ncbi:hypothetical protein Q1695_011486 [Nippostrongylus brasiliensis]|nr:hypothetical protein Q1695_011486 [Nippostrongylus brasiliensis]